MNGRPLAGPLRCGNVFPSVRMQLCVTLVIRSVRRVTGCMVGEPHNTQEKLAKKRKLETDTQTLADSE
jgi:hypothetical protein